MTYLHFVIAGSESDEAIQQMRLSNDKKRVLQIET
jgi:hypothetical protein